jgi:hypothetical protein
MDNRILFHVFGKNKGLFFKNLFDLNLQISPLCDKNPCIRQACFKIRPAGMQIYTNIRHSIHVNAKIKNNFFETFVSDAQELNVGVSLEYLKNAFKNAKKIDDVVIKIIGDSNGIPDVIEIKIIKNQKNDLTNKIVLHFEIKVTLIQNELLEFNERITDPVSVTNEEYVNICRNIQLQPGWVDVYRHEQRLTFSFQNNDITKSSIGIGGDGDEQPTQTEPIRFNSVSIKNSNKISIFSPKLAIYCNKYQPMVVESETPDVNISIWIKSNDQLIQENNK